MTADAKKRASTIPPAAPDKSRAIIEAARDRFRYYGIGKTTMQEIAQDAGVAVGTLYLYFSNKDALVVACAEGYAERHKLEAERVMASNRPADAKLRQYLIDRFRQAEEARFGSRHAVEITRAVLRVKPDRLVEEGQMMWQVLVRLLELGQREGVLHCQDPQEDAKVLLYSIGAFFPNALAEPPPAVREEDMLLVVDWFLRVWKQKPPRTQRRKASPAPGKRRQARLS